MDGFSQTIATGNFANCTFPDGRITIPYAAKSIANKRTQIRDKKRGCPENRTASSVC